ncbi:MAG: hypothetical protein J3R72DRAFT_428661 [Linnemannia gamsii]|nr:MAG: hypothetical protein J3R72DRAFT_428661 [Linnemannia gamsii]
MSAYTFFDQFERNVVPVLAVGALEKEGDRTFFDTCLTKEQREDAVTELIGIGRKKKETYQVFARHIHQIFRRLRIAIDNHVVLTLLKGCITDDEYTKVHLFWFTNAVATNTLNRNHEPETLDDFCLGLEMMKGPKEATESKDSRDHSSSSKDKSSSSSEKSTRKQYCKHCKKMVLHSSDEHVECSYCHKFGHDKGTCHTFQKD